MIDGGIENGRQIESTRSFYVFVILCDGNISNDVINHSKKQWKQSDVDDIKKVVSKVKYWRRDWDQEDAWIVLFPSSENRALIKGLDPFTEYFVSVMAVNSAGNGPESEPAVARTYRSGKTSRNKSKIKESNLKNQISKIKNQISKIKNQRLEIKD